MDSKKFIQVLRQIIREEVQTAVRTELSNLQLNEVKKPSPPAKPSGYSVKPIIKTGNTTLNEILNSTKPFKSEGPMAVQEEFEEWPTMPLTNLQTRQVSSGVINGVDGLRVNAAEFVKTEAGAAVVSALTRDYSALMKAIDTKKGK